MALGLSNASSSGDYLPILKYDARAGRFFRVDRAQDATGQYQSNNVDITNTFGAQFDMNAIEVGYINFATGGAPDFRLVPLGQPLPPKPGDGYKQGFRLKLKLAKNCGADVREFASCAGVVIGAIDALHTQYEAAASDHRGQLPVVRLTGTTAVKSGSGAKTSTNYAPVFEIVKWMDADPELVGGASSAAATPAAAPEPPKLQTAAQVAPQDDDVEF